MGFRVLSTRSTSEQVLQVDGLDHKVWEAAGAKKKKKKRLSLVLQQLQINRRLY